MARSVGVLASVATSAHGQPGVDADGQRLGLALQRADFVGQQVGAELREAQVAHQADGHEEGRQHQVEAEVEVLGIVFHAGLPIME
jgi:hypothetical protein